MSCPREAVDHAGARVHKDPRARHDPCVLRGLDRDLDDLDSKQRCIGIFRRVAARASGKLITRSDEGCTGNIDVNVVRIFRISDKRVSVRTAAGLNRRDLFWLCDIADVKDSNAAKPVLIRRGMSRRRLARRRGRIGRECLLTAIGPSVRRLNRHEQQVFIDGRVALTAGADHRRDQPGLSGVADVVDIDAVKVSLKKVLALKREVRIRKGEAGDHELHRGRYHPGVACNNADALIHLRVHRVVRKRERVGFFKGVYQPKSRCDLAGVVHSGLELGPGVFRVGPGHTGRKRRRRMRSKWIAVLLSRGFWHGRRRRCLRECRGGEYHAQRDGSQE